MVFVTAAFTVVAGAVHGVGLFFAVPRVSVLRHTLIDG